VIELANIAHSYYGVCDVGGAKVVQLASHINTELGETHVIPRNNKFIRVKRNVDLCVITVDSLTERKRIWDSGLIRTRYWVDLRTAWDQIESWCVDMSSDAHKIAYQETLTRKANHELPCGAKATAGITIGAANYIIGSIVYNVVNSTLPPFHIYMKLGPAFVTVQQNPEEKY